MQKTIYYLPGRGGRIDSGLGHHLLEKGFDVTGRAVVDEFNRLSFADQVDTIAKDIFTHFWEPTSLIVANSFGAYLFLYAQIQLAPFPGKVLLLSPIVGESTNQETSTTFIPPRADQIFKLAGTGKYSSPINCQMHVGSEDWQSNPMNVQKLAALINAKAFVVNGSGHSLPKSYVGQLLDEWLE